MPLAEEKNRLENWGESNDSGREDIGSINRLEDWEESNNSWEDFSYKSSGINWVVCLDQCSHFMPKAMYSATALLSRSKLEFILAMPGANDKSIHSSSRHSGDFFSMYSLSPPVMKSLRNLGFQDRGQGYAEIHLEPSVSLKPDPLETFSGSVVRIIEDTAYVCLQAEDGTVFDGEYPAALLAERGIQENSKFVAKVLPQGDDVEISIERAPYLELTDEEERTLSGRLDSTFGEVGVWEVDD